MTQAEERGANVENSVSEVLIWFQMEEELEMVFDACQKSDGKLSYKGSKSG